MAATVGNPFEYVLKRVSWAFSGEPVRHDRAHARDVPEVRTLTAADLKDALRKGLADFTAARDDVAFIAVFYPLAGLVLAAAFFRYDMLPMIFPLVSGFALLGPFAAIGLYEISRRREAGEDARWWHAASVLGAPGMGGVLVMGLILVGLFLAWLGVAYQISLLAFADAPPVTFRSFLEQVFATGEGWAMAIIGVAAGFLFAVVALAISAISFPMLLDRRTDVDVAIRTSLKVVAHNPRTMALWGLIVAASLAIGALPALLGLIVVVPVLGHATWHLYRRVVA